MRTKSSMFESEAQLDATLSEGFSSAFSFFLVTHADTAAGVSIGHSVAYVCLSVI